MVFLVFTREKALPVISYALALAASAALSQISWQKNAKLSSVQYEKTIKFKNILDISIPMMLSSSMSFIMNWTAIIMLGMFKTDVEVGVFNVAERIATFTSITLVAINSIAAPKFAEFYGKNDVKGLEKIAKQSNKLIFWTALPIMAVIFLFPSFILGIFGEEFKTGFYALIILTVGQFINAISGSVVSILQMTGKEKVFQNIMVIATLLNVVLNAVLIPRYGIIGAALANMLSMSLWNLSSLIYIKLYLNIVTLYIPIISKDLIFWRK
jgi:O-antigen/teichoic acid export membrane protein